MAMTDHLKTLVAKQKEILSELEKESAAIAENDLTKENDALKAALEKLKADYSHSEDNLKQLSAQNTELKNALYEQIYNEKLTILNMSAEKLNIYFKANYEDELNKLTVFEDHVKDRINTMAHLVRKHNLETVDEIQEKLKELSYLLEQKMTEARLEAAKTSGVFSDNEKAEFEALKNEQITERQVIDSAKKNNIEAFIGLNLINKLGLLLIVIGVIAASQFVYKQMPDSVKSIMMFVLGGLMMGAGEVLSRKKANVFSIGLTAGGVAVLYVALVTSSLVLKLPFFVSTMYPALITIILITAAAFYLSQRYKSQTIAAFALIGGYLPIFKVLDDLNLMYWSMAYFVVLNVFALLLSLNKKWTITTFVGLALNIAGTLSVCMTIIDMIYYQNTVPGKAVPFGFPQAAIIAYIFFAFVIYTLIPVFGTYFKKSGFDTPDIFLLGINTLFSSVFMVSVFYIFGLDKYLGLLAFAFAVIYLSIGLFIQAKFKQAVEAQALFYITGFVFIILIIPFQFGTMWLSLGWLLEGILLTVYGILKNEKVFKACGYILDGLCLGSFLMFDLLMGWSNDLAVDTKYDLFPLKYSLITLGSLVILGSFIYKKIVRGEFQTVFKYLTAINLWIFAVYISYKLLYDMFYPELHKALYSPGYLAAALAIVFTFALAYFMPRIKILTDLGMEVISMILYGAGIVWLFVMNTQFSPVLVPLYHAAGGNTKAVGTVILLVMGLLSVFALMELMKTLVMERQVEVEWYPLLVSAYFVILLTQNLIAQYNLAFSSVWLSMIYMATALSWIIFGFMKRYKFIRVFGLCLSFLAVAKLFILDLYDLTQGFRIISYFALGVALLAISFIYQYFNKRLEMKEATVKKAED